MLSRSAEKGAQPSERAPKWGRPRAILSGLGQTLAVILAVSVAASGQLSLYESHDGAGHPIPPARQGPQAALPEDAVPHHRHRLGRTARILGHIDGAEEACLPAGASDRSSPEKSQLSNLFQILEKSPLGRDLLGQAALRDVLICLDGETELLAYYFPGLRLIGVKASLGEGARIGFLAHELAHVPQHPIYSDNRYFPARDLMLLRRVREAAAESIATCIVWQLREAGYAAAWHAKRLGAYGDLAAAFETAMRGASGAPDAADSEQAATRAAFDSWFAARWRLDVYDRMTVEHLARISNDGMGLVPPRLRLSHRFLSGIGRYGRGNFLKPAADRRLTDDYYRGSVSNDNAKDLQAVFRARSAEGNTDDPWLIVFGS